MLMKDSCLLSFHCVRCTFPLSTPLIISSIRSLKMDFSMAKTIPCRSLSELFHSFMPCIASSASLLSSSSEHLIIEDRDWIMSISAHKSLKSCHPLNFFD
ncbi:Os03g0418733 [Oryza sativa Japonica Group]|uniref:Os03g0418733 protein n=1 Tax=Oryza sativa subsp. japonica TaxID=39947 RepID=A0A0P0VZK0_ORYSJ|nr:hypothetical protein EE612_018146 [Oryza sativa]BAS84722.1 Os03g0418733 [Oryza sativa Japonica Group]